MKASLHEPDHQAQGARRAQGCRAAGQGAQGQGGQGADRLGGGCGHELAAVHRRTTAPDFPGRDLCCCTGGGMGGRQHGRSADAGQRPVRQHGGQGRVRGAARGCARGQPPQRTQGLREGPGRKGRGDAAGRYRPAARRSAAAVVGGRRARFAPATRYAGGRHRRAQAPRSAAQGRQAGADRRDRPRTGAGFARARARQADRVRPRRGPAGRGADRLA